MNTSEGAIDNRTKNIKNEKTEGFNLNFLENKTLFRAKA